MKRVFLDTDVLLDVLLKRDPFYAASAAVWMKAESREVEGLISVHSLAAIFCLVRKRAGRPAARRAIGTICEVLRVVDSPGKAGRMALESRMPDLEDALQYATAVLAQADCVLTRNTVDFPRRGKVAVMTPEDFLRPPRGAA